MEAEDFKLQEKKGQNSNSKEKLFQLKYMSAYENSCCFATCQSSFHVKLYTTQSFLANVSLYFSHIC